MQAISSCADDVTMPALESRIHDVERCQCGDQGSRQLRRIIVPSLEHDPSARPRVTPRPLCEQARLAITGGGADDRG